ncbi:MAG: hypothetical protein M1826_002335 [Phylliscum demangeonii]|nr:MAG: hypothetical protein M1826_002335 [Phylliscum demangeonii]
MTDEASANRQNDVDRDSASVEEDLEIKQGAKKKSIDDLMEDPKLQKIAQSSGYPVEELAKAKRRLLDAENAAVAFKTRLAEVEKVRKVTPEEKGQLQALGKARYQQVTVFRRMSKGLPANQQVPRKKSIDDLLGDRKLHEIAQSSGYPVEELAKARRRFLDAHNAAVAFKKELAEAEKVRKVTTEEKGQLQALMKARSQQVTVFRRMSRGLPANQQVPRKKSIDDFLEDRKLQEIAQSSGYPVEELAKARRRFLDAHNAAVAFKKELAEAEKVRKVTTEEKGQLQALGKAASQQHTVFHRMSQGLPGNRPVLRKKSMVEDPKLQEIAQSSGYPVEELAEAKRRWLDATKVFRAFRKELTEAATVREVIPEERRQLKALEAAASQQETVFGRMSQGLPVDKIDTQDIVGDSQLLLDASNKLRAFEEQMAVAQQAGHSPTFDVKAQHRALQDDFNEKTTMWLRGRVGTPVDRVVHKGRGPKPAPSPETGGPGSQEQASQASPTKEDIDVAALRRDAKVDEVAHLNPVAYTPAQIAMFDQAHLDALNELLNFQQRLSALKRSGGSVSPAHEVYLKMLQDGYNLQRAWWEKARRGVSIHGLNHEGRSVTYTAQEIASYHQLFLDASDKLRAFEEQMAVAQPAGHSPTRDVEVQRLLLIDDVNKKKTMWFRALDGMPVDRVVPKRREPKTTPSPETRRAGNQAQASQASPAKEDPSTTHPPLQMSGPRRLLAPFVSSASHLLQVLGRQWRAMPWTRYLAELRLNKVTPADLLRTEHALP